VLKLIIFLFCLASFAYPQTLTPPDKLNFKARLNLYLHRTYTDPWRHVWLLGEVAEDDFATGGVGRWGSGFSGYGKSLATVYGQRVISNSVEFLSDAFVFHGDARYRPSTSGGLFKRGLHATVSTFTAQAQSGNTRPAYARIIAVTSALLIAERWRPHPETGLSLADALVFNVVDMAEDNMLAEFKLDLKKVGQTVWHRIRPAKNKKHGASVKNPRKLAMFRGFIFAT
jgi:hypothetical protein